ncbi:MAG: class I SAM-dependent methyltransferase [Acidobacteriota bacterium]|nr:class I SAM-dependent methyltransferase [Acidobacteriota bacterium]
MTDRRARRATFDAVAERYHRARPDYPDELLDDLVETAGLLPGARVLEVGCGTGKATVPLAQRGLALTCVELGASLAAVAERNLAAFPAVEIVVADFEEWTPRRGGYDALLSFTAYHWIQRDLRYVKAAEMLRDGGTIAVAMIHHVLPPGADPFFLEAQADYAAVGRGGNPPGPPEAVEAFGEEMAASGFFELVAERRYQWDVEYTADEYVALIGTYSENIAMPERTRRELFDRLRARIGEGCVRKTYLATLDLAVRR